jgi:hypothetical protein
MLAEKTKWNFLSKIFAQHIFYGGVFRFTSRGGIQIFSLIYAQNLQVKFLVVFKSDESLIFVVFFF